MKRDGKIPRNPPRWTTQVVFRFYTVAVVIAMTLAVVLGVSNHKINIASPKL